MGAVPRSKVLGMIELVLLCLVALLFAPDNGGVMY